MRNRIAFLSVALLVSLAAAPALALDPLPNRECKAGNVTVTTDGLKYVSCNGGSTCTEITYSLTSSNADHVGTFVRAEAGLVTGDVVSQTSPCEGDSVFGIPNGVVCHETIVRVNPEGLTNSFTLRVDGQRDPIATSIVVKKGNKLNSCAIEGIGLESASSGNCVASCGSFDAFQTITKTEVFSFKGCFAEFVYDLNTGEVVEFNRRTDLDTVPGCDIADGDIGELSLLLNGDPTPGFPGVLEFGDGWVGEGDSSATWRFVAGRWYCIGTSCPR
jgi:hypothetical protein